MVGLPLAPRRGGTPERIANLTRFADELAGFLAALYEIDPAGGPPPGAHSFFRGGPVATFDADVRGATAALADGIDTAAATAVWEQAVASRWEGPPVWVHGDITPSNLLVDDGRLSAVIDFGCSAVGDPACDLAIAWTFFRGDSRRTFRERLALDDATWTRGRGWALWKALITVAETDPDLAENADPSAADRAARRFGWTVGARAVIDEVIADA